MDIFGDEGDSFAEYAFESELAFKRKVLLRILRFFEIRVPGGMRDDPTFGFDWFHEEYPDFPIRMDVKKVKSDISSLFKSLTKTDIWDEYMQALDMSGCGRYALISPVLHHGLFAIHNWWSLPTVPGYTRLVRVAKSSDKGIVVEPMEAFLLAIKTNGWGPYG